MSREPFTRFVGLTSLIDSTIAFLSAFGLEALLFSDELWTRLPVGVVLAIIILLISWCVSTTLEAKADFSFCRGVHAWKDGLVNFTRGLRGKTPESGSDAGDPTYDDGPGKGGMLRRSETFKEAFNRLRPRRARASTSATLVNPTGTNVYGPQTAVEMGKIDNKVSGSVV